MKITTKHVSNFPVTFVTHECFAVLFFLPSCCVNSLLWTTTSSQSTKTQKRICGQYPAIFTSPLLNNAYILLQTKWNHTLGDLWRHCGPLGIEILMPYPINQRAHCSRQLWFMGYGIKISFPRPPQWRHRLPSGCTEEILACEQALRLGSREKSRKGSTQKKTRVREARAFSRHTWRAC